MSFPVIITGNIILIKVFFCFVLYYEKTLKKMNVKDFFDDIRQISIDWEAERKSVDRISTKKTKQLKTPRTEAKQFEGRSGYSFVSRPRWEAPENKENGVGLTLHKKNGTGRVKQMKRIQWNITRSSSFPRVEKLFRIIKTSRIWSWK